MRRYPLSSVFIVLLVVGFLVWHGKSTPKTSLEYPLNSSTLRSFLESQYVPEAGLLRAAVKAHPDNETIYVANDNLLASHALVALGSPIGRRVLENFNANYSGGWSGKVDPLLGRPITGFYCPRDPKSWQGLLQDVQRNVRDKIRNNQHLMQDERLGILR
ncbi:hypothetical protein [Thermococcus gorgonarius]|uniref:hypothetical protein n=1 Tax=Thermococcus gorgonarius TaxID=71997 RepID=UPI001E4FD821|nr:hypothetical protein [Thermococcus gorgonarius]